MIEEATTLDFGPATIRPPFDPELSAVESSMRPAMAPFWPLSDENLPALRKLTAEGPPQTEPADLTAGGKVLVEERRVPGPAGASAITLLIARPVEATGALPVLYYIHGGGMVSGDHRTGIESMIPYVSDGSAVAVSVDYRLAPENPDPAPLNDCYAGLAWTAEHATELGGESQRLIAVGTSAGGGLAAGTALLARDRGYPSISHQVLICPMLDDRFETHSSRMLDGEGPWDRAQNLYGWTALLRERRGGPDVTPYTAPARATDLAGLPRTYIEVGTADGFRDEALTYGQRLSEAGVNVDLHMWGGGFHSFDLMAPHAAVSRACVAARDEFIRRALEH